MLTAAAWAHAAACTGGGTSTHAPVDATTPSVAPAPRAADPDGTEPPFTLGLMYWAPPSYVLGGSYALVVGGEIVEIHAEPAADPEVRGPTITHATIRVEHVFADIPPPPRPQGTVERYAGQSQVRFDGAEGLAAGERVIVFAEAYDGGYGIVPKRDTGVQVGIRVADWSDPIVPALGRYLAGTADLRRPTDAEPWRRFGEAAIACVLDGVPPGHCGMD